MKQAVFACCPTVLRPYWSHVENSPLAYRLARGAFWSLAGAFISRGLMLASTVVAARLLGKAVYGELGMIQSTLGMFGVFAGLGLGLTATKYVAEFRDTDPKRAGRIIALSRLLAAITGGLLALGLLVLATYLAQHIINAPHLAGALRIGSLLLLMDALNGAQTGALSGFEAFKTIARVNVFVGLASFPIIIGGAYLGGLTGAVWALVINLAVNWLLNHLALRKEAHRLLVPLTFCFCRQDLTVLWRFSLPAVLAGVMVGPANWAARALLANQLDGYKEMGTLTAALVFQNLLLFVSGTLNQPLMSMVSNAGRQGGNQLAVLNILATWILGVGFAVPLLCFPEIAQWVFGPEYASYRFRMTFALIVCCTSIMTYKSGLARALAASSLMWWGLLSNALWAATLILCARFFAVYGAAGLAASLTIAYVLNTAISVPFYSSRNLVPKGTLLSKEAVLIWCIIAGLVALNFLEATLSVRVIAFLLSVVGVAAAFMNIVKPRGSRCSNQALA